jgi:hypothetical protein
MTFWYRSLESIPVGRVKDRKPLGHSGHLRLHDVVGSKETLAGNPFIFGFFEDLDR